MPAAVLDLDASALPTDGIALPNGHDRAYTLLRWRGRPIGITWLDAPDGRLSGDALRAAVADVAAMAIPALRTAEWLQWSEVRPLDLPPEPTLTVAVCTRDRLEDLARCLAALAALPDDGQEVLVVDSASRDGAAVAALVRRHAATVPRLRLVREERAGADRARNRALREARGEVVAFCDDDAAPDPRWLRALARHFGDPRTMCVTGLTMPLQLETEAQEWFERTNGFARGFHRMVHDGAQDDAFFVARVGASVNMALRRTALAHVGPLDEALDPGTPTLTGGDHDYFTRVLQGGWRIVYEPEALVWHRHRREWAELRATVRGYGTGVWAYLTAHFARGEPRALVVALSWTAWQLAELVRESLRTLLGRPRRHRMDLQLAELRGCFAGPGAYRRSVRALRATRQAEQGA